MFSLAATAAEDVETNFATSAALIADSVQTGAGGFEHAVLVKGGKVFMYQLNGAVMNGKAPELTPVNFSAPVVKVAAGGHVASAHVDGILVSSCVRPGWWTSSACQLGRSPAH